MISLGLNDALEKNVPPLDPKAPIIEDVDVSTNAYIRSHYKGFLIGFIIVVLALSVIVVIFKPEALFQLLVFSFVIGFGGYGYVNSKIQREFMQQFAALIGFTYSATADISTVGGRMFTIGRGQKIYNVMSGSKNSRPTRIYNYDFIVGSGKSSHTYTYTVFETTFDNMMPDMTLMKKNGMFSGDFLSQGSISEKGTEKVELEGDFNKYFTVRVPKNYEPEAYEILTPDIMADLIDKARDLEFEMNGNKLYIIAWDEIKQRSKLAAMFNLSEYLDNVFMRSSRGVNVGAAATNV